jgi:YidC/Oxa1 family membrane protein insertase
MKPRQTVVLIVLGIALIFGWQHLVNWIWPTKPKPTRVVEIAHAAAEAGAEAGLPLPTKEAAVAMVAGGMSEGPALIPKPVQEAVTLATGGLGATDARVAALRRAGRVEQPAAKKDVPTEVKAAEPPAEAPELIALGHGDKPFYLQVLFNSRGGSVQQVIVTEFPEADREGLEVMRNGKPVPLHLIPGVPRPRGSSVRADRNKIYPELQPGVVADAETLEAVNNAGACYLLYHYDKPGDERPINTLGIINWKKAEVENDPAADEQKVVFQAELGAPHNVIITKTFTLKRKDYHIGLRVDVWRKPGTKGPNQFRYQLSGAHGLPIEGEWYTSTYRQAIVGFADAKGNTSRYVEDSREVRKTEGSDRQTRTDKLAIRFAAVTVQYFASAIAVDDQQENRNFVEFARATPLGPTHKEQEFLDDLTVRTITEAFNPEEAAHKYLLYQGPIKVRLLRQMPKNEAVDDGLVDRYIDQLHLDLMTDAPLPNFLGRFANAIYWTDIVIAFTNLVHSLLWALYQVVPNLGLCIIFVTIIVRGLLFPLSRRQAHNAQVMQAKMAKLQPELNKIKEKYADDMHRQHLERMRVMREHGVNPFAMMGGCLMLILQMPIMMGLYYALQESVFFRLHGFLWVQNLAAPDMLVWWGEGIPFISKPQDIGSTLYMGPYLNILPVIAVTLMMYQQGKMMPKSDDPQVQAQQRMMKIMMIMFGLFFYKVPAGLCLYFIASTLWGIAERKIMPKPVKPEELDDAGPPTNGEPAKPLPPRPLGWWGRKKQRWREKWQELLENAQKQAEHRRQQQGGEPPPASRPGGGGGGGGKKKKKKKR